MLKLKSFEVAFVIDATGSMASSLMWLRKSIRPLFKSLAMIAREPRVGVTYFSAVDAPILHQPMTPNIGGLARWIEATGVQQSGVNRAASGLEKAIKSNRWSRSKNRHARVVVLLGDGVEENGREIPAWVKQIADNVWLMAASTRSSNSTFKELAKQADGEYLVVNMNDRVTRYDAIRKPSTSPLSSTQDVVYEPEEILIRMMTRAINPQYADRVRPFVKLLVAYNR